MRGHILDWFGSAHAAMIKSNSKQRGSVSTHAIAVVVLKGIVVVDVGVVFVVVVSVHSPHIWGQSLAFSLSAHPVIMKLKSKHWGSVSWQGFAIVVVVADVVVKTVVISVVVVSCGCCVDAGHTLHIFGHVLASSLSRQAVRRNSKSTHRSSLSSQTKAAWVVAIVVAAAVVMGNAVVTSLLDVGEHKPHICGQSFAWSGSEQPDMMKLNSKHWGLVSWHGPEVVTVVVAVVWGGHVLQVTGHVVAWTGSTHAVIIKSKSVHLESVSQHPSWQTVCDREPIAVATETTDCYTCVLLYGIILYNVFKSSYNKWYLLIKKIKLFKVQNLKFNYIKF